MAITVSTLSPYTRLTTTAKVQAELGIATDATLLDALVDRASAAVETYCNRTFQRETLTETLPGFGDIHLQLTRTPIVSVSSVTYNTSTTITDYSVASAAKGWLYRQAGWEWTVQVWPGLTGALQYLDMGSPVPRSEEPLYSVVYTAGYLLPQADVTATTISVSSDDNSFNDSASGFPPNLKAGDIITTSGFTTDANNGRFVVSGTPTTAKVIVTSTMTTEAAGSSRSIAFANLPLDVEKATIETAKAYYSRRSSDGSIVEKQAGPMRVRYSETELERLTGIPATAAGLLRPWVRNA